MKDDELATALRSITEIGDQAVADVARKFQGDNDASSMAVTSLLGVLVQRALREGCPKRALLYLVEAVWEAEHSVQKSEEAN